MANPIGVHVVGTEITEKHVFINRENPKIMSIEKAMGNFCKILGNHDDREKGVDIAYSAKITNDCRIVFNFIRPNSEEYDYNTYMYIGLEEKAWDGRWYGGCRIHVDVKDSRDVWALVEEFKERIKAKYATETYNSAIELKDAILAV